MRADVEDTGSGVDHEDGVGVAAEEGRGQHGHDAHLLARGAHRSRVIVLEMK